VKTLARFPRLSSSVRLDEINIITSFAEIAKTGKSGK
jgi:hypothetical protein